MGNRSERHNAEGYYDPTAYAAIENLEKGKMKVPIHYTIKGDPRTKKNSQRIMYKGPKCPKCHKGGIPFIMPSAAFKEYEEKALWQIVPKPRSPITQRVNVKCVFFMQTHRNVDLNNLLESICDILVAAHVLEDDKSGIVAGHDGSRVLYDKYNPRVEITITKMDDFEQLELI